MYYGKSADEQQKICSTVNVIEGNSGGATVTHEGKLVGITAQALSGPKVGIIYASIRSNLVKEWAETLIKREKGSNKTS